MMLFSCCCTSEHTHHFPFIVSLWVHSLLFYSVFIFFSRFFEVIIILTAVCCRTKAFKSTKQLHHSIGNFSGINICLYSITLWWCCNRVIVIESFTRLFLSFSLSLSFLLSTLSAMVVHTTMDGWTNGLR